jgi:RNA polymerase-associated protein CTR9
MQALHIQPNDKAVIYNIAMIQQKSAEMLFATPPSKRTLRDLQTVIDQAAHAQKCVMSFTYFKSRSYLLSTDYSPL